jgi:phosphatidylinositol alpha-mannosyltransferase
MTAAKMFPGDRSPAGGTEQGKSSSLRVLLASPYDLTYIGGVTSHIFDLAAQLRLEGHEVTVAGATGDGRVQDGEVVSLGGSFRFPTRGDAARVNLNPLVHLKVRDLLKQGSFDVLHMHEPFLGFIGSSLMRYGDAVKVGTFHTWNKRTHYPYLVFGPLVRRWNHMLDGRIAVSERARITVNRYVPDTYTVIPNGINYQAFAEAAPPPEHLRDRKPTILFVGRLEARKGVQVLLRSFKAMKPRIPRLRLVIVGEGSMDGTLRRWVREHALDDVFFEGFQRRADLPGYYHCADVFCSPSVENESAPITLLEAMAAGRPVVATEGNGSHIVGSSGETGLVVPPDDPFGLADALERFLEDDALAERVGAAAQLRAQEFDWQIIARTIVDYYAEAALESKVPLKLASPYSAGS